MIKELLIKTCKQLTLKAHLIIMNHIKITSNHNINNHHSLLINKTLCISQFKIKLINIRNHSISYLSILYLPIISRVYQVLVLNLLYPITPNRSNSFNNKISNLIVYFKVRSLRIK